MSLGVATSAGGNADRARTRPKARDTITVRASASARASVKANTAAGHVHIPRKLVPTTPHVAALLPAPKRRTYGTATPLPSPAVPTPADSFRGTLSLSLYLSPSHSPSLGSDANHTLRCISLALHQRYGHKSILSQEPRAKSCKA